MKIFFKPVIILSLFFLFLSILSSAQNNIKRELRAAWIATYSNIDWPDRGEKPEQQKEDFIKIIEHHKTTGINAVYVQIRSQSDAMYPSALEPWSADLTGVQGMPPDPFWDPLAFMINECRKRGIEFHAWINPYRVAGKSTNIASFSQSHVSKKHPEWLLRSGSKVTLNPGLPQVREHIVNVISDILDRYDVDGIHFDDYFYPEPGFNDAAAFSNEPREFISRADWRRDNVNLLIEQVSEKINSKKPWVKFGISPSGIYRNSTDPGTGSATSGMEHYSELYADSKKWLKEGWVDYIEPQVYWYSGQRAADYDVLIPWWNNNSFGRHVYIGMAGYKVESWGNSPWADPNQIPKQLRLNRSFINQNIKGSAFYNTSSMMLNLLGFNDSLKNNFYRYPALIPRMPWKDSISPLPPTAFTGQLFENSITLQWDKPTGIFNEADKPRQYVVYRSLEPQVNIEMAENIVAIITDTFSFTDTTILSGPSYHYVVTSLDRLYNESKPTPVLTIGKMGLPVTINSFTVIPLNDKEFGINWSVNNDSLISGFEVQRSMDGSDFKSIKVVLLSDSLGARKYSVSDKAGSYNVPVFYRLLLKDSSGKQTYSKTLAQTIKKDIDIVRFNTRIPKGNDMRIGVLLTGNFEYAIFDEERKKIKWGKIRALPVLTQVILPETKDLPAGNYILNINFNNLTQNIPVHIP